MKKRETLVVAITHNIKYLAKIHGVNSAELKLTKEKLASITKWNDEL